MNKEAGLPQSSQCLECRYYQGLSRCDAYPDHIPSEIFAGLHDHRKPYPGDKGIRWEPDPELLIDTDD